jgi:hypothetical protein
MLVDSVDFPAPPLGFATTTTFIFFLLMRNNPRIDYRLIVAVFNRQF